MQHDASTTSSNKQHIPYEKMGNAATRGGKNNKGWRDLRKLRFVISEKIHGANFSIRVSAADGTNIDVDFAKRTALLTPEEDFFGCVSSGLTQRLRPLAIEAFRKAQLPEGTLMIIFGELFGGQYPHEDVTATEQQQQQAVQTGVSYSPNLNYIAYDVGLLTIDAHWHYLPFDEARQLVEPCGIMFAETLFEGSYEECMAYEIGFDSTIPARFAMPPLPAGSNAAEGIVLRSARSLANGVRSICKRKISAFSESQFEDEEMSRAHQVALDRRARGEAIDEETLRGEALSKVTRQRLDNVLSKTGRMEVTDNKMKKLVLRSFINDIMDEMREEFGLLFEPNNETKRVLGVACNKVLLEAFATE